VVAKLRESLAVNKQRLHRLNKQRLNLNKLNKVEGKDVVMAANSLKGTTLFNS
jgi:hypothetical protein